MISYWHADHRTLHSFPTRRSSDLGTAAPAAQPRGAPPPTAVAPPPTTVKKTVVRKRRVRTRTTVFFTVVRSEEHTSELQSRRDLVCRLLLEKKKRAGVQTVLLKD